MLAVSSRQIRKDAINVDLTDFVEIERFPKYRISLDGYVVSLFGRAPRVLKPIKMGAYVGLQLKNKYGVLEKIYLHRLIAEAAYGPCPVGHVCCHNDGNKRNNSSGNLRWDTVKSNGLDKFKHGTVLYGEANPMSKLTESEVQAMRDIRAKTGAPYNKIAPQFGVTTMTAYRAIVGQAWSKT